MEDFIIRHGLPLLFLVIAVESFGVPVPGETALIAFGVLASQGHYPIEVVIIVAALAAADSPAARPAAAAMGLVLLAWLIIETIVIGYRGPVQIGFLIACGASGVALVHCARARPQR